MIDPRILGLQVHLHISVRGSSAPYIHGSPIVTTANHVIIGDAASAHHAWVVGALESATRGVYQFLFAHSGNSKAINNALDAYIAGDIEKPFGPLPSEFDRMKDVGEAGVDVDMNKAATEGEWARQGVIFERIRLEQGGDQLDLSKVTKKDVAPLLTAGHMHEI